MKDKRRVALHIPEDSTKWIAWLYVQTEEGSKRKHFPTKESDRDKAYQIAYEELIRFEYDLKNGRSHKTPTFGQIAREYIDLLNDSAEITKHEKTCISALKKYFIPFFEKKKIDAINTSELIKFNIFREEKHGKPFYKSTISNHNAAINKVFKYASSKGLIKKSDIPSVEISGERTKPRDSFEDEDIIKIYDYLANAKSKNKVRNETYELLYYYVDFVINTGARPGTEVNNIQWKDFTLYALNDLVRLGVYIRKGKNSSVTGPRKAVPSYGFIDSYVCMLKDNPNKNPEDYVFRTKSGKSLDQVGKVFSEVLQKLGIKDGPNGPRSLYSLRHTFVTLGLKKGLDHNKISRAIGTSIQMIEKHYNKSKTSDFEDQLFGVKTKKKLETDYEDPITYIIETHHTYKFLVNRFLEQKKAELGNHFSIDAYDGVLKNLEIAEEIINKNRPPMTERNKSKRQKSEIVEKLLRTTKPKLNIPKKVNTKS